MSHEELQKSMLILLHLGALALIGLGFWWLSRYDSQLTHENQKADILRRGIRCGVTLLLLEIIVWLPPTVIFLVVVLAVIWAGCLAELASHSFRWLIDPEDRRKYDPARNLRELDAVARLIREGKKAEAIQLCNVLKEGGEVDPVALELTLAHLGAPPPAAKKVNPLNAASRLRQQGKFPEAASLLNSLLAENPGNVDAALLLVRIYAQDLHRPDMAMAALRVLEMQPQVPSSHIEFARRSIDEWHRGKPGLDVPDAQPESIDELLTQGYLGTALEILEQKIKDRPGDFDLRLKFAEVYGQHCGDIDRAGKIVREIEAHPGFNPEQIQRARAGLEAWRKARPRGA
jgi:tetratricopeptide (TPR) repeat protein